MGLSELHDFIKSTGYDFEVTTINGKWQKTTDSNGHKIWYIGSDLSDQLLTFTFGDFREPDKRFHFCSKTALTTADEGKLKKFAKRVEKDKSLKQEITKSVVENLWSDWVKTALDDNADYLVAKGLPRPAGVLVKNSTEDNQKILVIPLRDSTGELWNIQTIYAGGDKPLHPGARIKGCFYTFGSDIAKAPTVLVGEGFATCFAAHLATNLVTLCAFNIANLEEVVRDLIRRGIPSTRIRLLADWDGATFKKTGKNPGMLAVQKLTKKYKVGFVEPLLPGMPGDRNWDFADIWDEKNPGLVNTCCGRVLYFADISADVYSVKKSDEPALDMTCVPDASPLLTEEEIQVRCEEVSKKQMAPGDEKLVITQKLEVKRLGDPWLPVKHDIVTRNSGFHQTTIKKGGGVDYEPVYTDLRLAFEEVHPFVTHRESEVVYAFNGKVYEMVPELSMGAFAEKMFDPKPRNSDVREFVGAVTRYNVRGNEFFETPKLINFQNGWLDLKSMEFRPHTPDVGFKNVLTYDLDPEATCPEFDAFLLRVLSGDQALVDMVMEFLGYAISGDECWTAKALVLKGEGSNGKSTFLKIARALIGKANILAAKVNDFKSEYVRQQLDGKLVCISEETPKESLLDTSHFKDIVAGGTIGVRAIYGTPYNLDVRTKVIFSCNDMPPSGDTSHALLRRLLIVPFNVTFSEEEADPFIDRRLLKELPGILNKALIAYMRLVERGRFGASEAMSAAIREYQYSTNPVIQWLEEQCSVFDEGPNYEKIGSISEMYIGAGGFAQWANARGYKQMSIDNFGKTLRRSLKNVGGRFVRHRHNGVQFRGAKGVLKKNASQWLPEM